MSEGILIDEERFKVILERCIEKAVKRALRPDDSPHKLLSISAVAKRLDVHPQTVRRWIAEQGLPSIQHGPKAHVRIREESLEDWLQEREG